jgi:hypothetical protein
VPPPPLRPHWRPAPGARRSLPGPPHSVQGVCVWGGGGVLCGLQKWRYSNTWQCNPRIFMRYIPCAVSHLYILYIYPIYIYYALYPTNCIANSRWDLLVSAGPSGDGAQSGPARHGDPARPKEGTRLAGGASAGDTPTQAANAPMRRCAPMRRRALEVRACRWLRHPARWVGLGQAGKRHGRA